MSVAPYDNLEQRRIYQIKSGEVRLIGKQSARKHKKQGHRVQWCPVFHQHIWFPQETIKVVK